MKPGKSTSFLQTGTSRIYDSSHKWQSDLWLLKWIALVFIILDFQWVNTTPMAKIEIVIVAEFLFLIYALLSTFFLRNKLSFNAQFFTLTFDFLVFSFFEYLSLSMFSSGSRIYVLYLIPIIYCGYWFKISFTLLFVTLVSATLVLLNYFIVIAKMERFLIFSEIVGTLGPIVAAYFLVSLLVLFFKKKFLKYFIDLDRELEKRTAELEQEKEYTRGFLKDKVDGFMAIDEKGYVTDINKLACDLFGYDEKDIYEQNVRDIYAPGEAAKIMKALRGSPDGTIENFRTFVINRKDKEEIPIQVSAAFLYDRKYSFQEVLKEKKRFSSLGYFRDLRAEEITDRIGREITSMKDEKGLLNRIAATISKTLKAEVCSIMIYNGTTDRLETSASFGMRQIFRDITRYKQAQVKFEEKEGMDGFVFSTGKTLNVKNIDILGEKIEVVDNKHNNINVKWDYIQNFAQCSIYKDFQHYLATPLRIKGEVYGVIKVLNKYSNENRLDERGFQDKDQILLERISSQVAVLVEKIRNKERFETISKIGMELNDKIDLPLEDFLKIVAGEVVNRMGFKACLIRLIEEGNKLRIRASYGFKHNYKRNGNLTLEIGEGTTGEVAKTGIDKIILDVSKSTKTKFRDILKKENLESMLSTPIKYQNRVIGVINCYTQQEHNFTQEEIQIVQTFAVYTAVAIQNRKRVQELLALNEIGSELVKPFQIEELFDLILERAKEISGADGICIQRYDERTREITTLRALDCEWYEKIKCQIRTIREDLINKAIKDEEPIIDNNYRIDSEHMEKIPYIDLLKEIKSRMIVPIKIYGRVFGVLCLDSKRANAFSEQDKLILGAFSNQAAAALRNANFFNKLQDVKETFPKISELSMDIHKVLDKIVDTAAKVLETDILVLYRYDDRSGKIILPPIYTGDIKYKEFIESEAIASDSPLSFIKRGESHYANKSREDPIMTSKGKPLPEGIPSRFVIRENIVSSAGIVLRVGKEIVGVMFINYRMPHEFNDDERQIIEIFASYVAIAIQNVKHFTEKKLADTMHTLGQIASNFAHKLKNDIGTLTLYTGDLLDDIKPGQPQYYPLSQIKEKTAKIKEEIDHLQRAAKMHIQEKRLIYIKDLIDELKEEIERELEMKKIALNINMPSTLPRIEVDPFQIELVLVNLARNSIEAMPKGGRISVSISKSKENILIEWADSGPGIPSENAAKIFDVFWTNKDKGYGLGLFHAKATIEEHRGSISLDASCKKGARFLIELPIKQEY